MSPCPSSHRLENYFYSGSPDTLGAHVSGCASCRTALETLKQDRQEFLSRFPFEKFQKSVVSRKPVPLWKRIVQTLFLPSPILRGAIAMAGVTGLMMFILWNHSQPDLTPKGGFGLTLYVSSEEGGLKKARDRMHLAAQSNLQFVYSTRSEKFFLLMGVEENEKTTVYFPQGGVASAPLQAGEREELPLAIRWEPTSSFERFYAVFSEAPLPVEEVLASLQEALKDRKTVEDLTRLPLASSQYSILLYRAAH